MKLFSLLKLAVIFVSLPGFDFFFQPKQNPRDIYSSNNKFIKSKTSCNCKQQNQDEFKLNIHTQWEYQQGGQEQKYHVHNINRISGLA